LLAVGFLGVVALLVLSWFSKTVSFEEEVQLDDGRKIIVKRSEHLKRMCEGVSCGWGLDVAKIRLPDTATWEFPGLVPLLLDLDANGRPVILANPSTCGDYVRMNKPVPPYLQFELAGGAWQSAKPSRRFHGRESNLLIAPNWDRGEASLVRLTEKLKRNNSAGLMPATKKINLDLTGFC